MSSVERMRPLLGTFVTIRAEGAHDVPQAVIATAVESAFNAIAQVDRLMSFHRRTSDVGRLNRARTGSRLRVHSWTHRVLFEALRLSAWSGGAFDCNIGATLMRGGLLPKLTCCHLERKRLAHVGIVLEKTGWVRLKSRVALDLGGIAKGFAVDKAVETLQRCGIASGLVNAGGDLRVFGTQMQPVWVRDSQDPTNVQIIGALANGAVATSAAYFVSTNRPHEAAMSAIVRPDQGRRVTMANSVSVIARNGMLADALTKIVVIKGRLPTRIARYAGARSVTV